MKWDEGFQAGKVEEQEETSLSTSNLTSLAFTQLCKMKDRLLMVSSTSKNSTQVLRKGIQAFH